MGLISRYLLNESLKDSIGEEHATGSNLMWVDGPFKRAVKMNTAKVSIPSRVTGQFTIAFYIRITSRTSDAFNLFMVRDDSGEDDGSRRSPHFYTKVGATRLHLRQNIGSGFNRGVDQETELELNRWYLVTYSSNIDPDGKTTTTSSLNGGNIVRTDYPGTPVVYGSVFRFLEGNYDLGGVWIYDHALSTAEIAALGKEAVCHITSSQTQTHDVLGDTQVVEHNVSRVFDSELQRWVSVFDGSGYLAIEPPFVERGLDQEWTVEALLKLESTTINQFLIKGFNHGLYLRYQTGGASTDSHLRPILHLNSGVNDYYLYGNKNAIPLNRWARVAYVFNNATGYRAIFVNGVDVSSSGPNRTSSPSGLDSIIYLLYNFIGRLAYIKFHRHSRHVGSTYKTISATDEVGNLILNHRRLFEVGTSRQPIVDYSVWKDDGSTGAVAGFGNNGLASKNSRVTDVGPFGEETVVWQANNTDTASHADGGWNSTTFPIDNTKRYRFAVWMRRKVIGNGSMYWGSHGYGSINGIRQLPNGGANTNPYFFHGAVNTTDWRLYVGFIHPHDHVDGLDPDNGIYDVNGNRLGSLRDFKWLPESTSANHRAYLYYSTDTSTVQQFVYPRVDVCDGTEPSLRDLLEGFDRRWVEAGFPKTLGTMSHRLGVGVVSEVGLARGLIHAFPFTHDFRDRCSPRIAEVNGVEIVSGGVLFDGASDLNLGTLDALGDEWSVMCMYHPLSFDQYTHLLSAYNQYVFAFKINKTSNGPRPYLHVNQGSFRFNAMLTVGQTYHLAVTYADGVIRQYIDGELDATHDVVIPHIAEGPYRVGRWNSERSNGIERDLRVFNRALAGGEIKLQSQLNSPQDGVAHTPLGLMSSGRIVQLD